MQGLLTIARLKKADVIPDGKHLIVELYCKSVKFSTAVSIGISCFELLVSSM